VGVPLDGYYHEVFNTDGSRYGGSNLGNLGGKFTNAWGMHGYENSLELCLPPLSVLVFRHDPARLPEPEAKAEAALPS
jgi:1,4-alpha-glucan branching enzyme